MTLAPELQSAPFAFVIAMYRSNRLILFREQEEAEYQKMQQQIRGLFTHIAITIIEFN